MNVAHNLVTKITPASYTQISKKQFRGGNNEHKAKMLTATASILWYYFVCYHIPGITFVYGFVLNYKTNERESQCVTILLYVKTLAEVDWHKRCGTCRNRHIQSRDHQRHF